MIANGTRDTVIQISNTSNSIVLAHCFYVDATLEDPSLPQGPLNPPRWQEIDFDIELTVVNDSDLSALASTTASIASVVTGADLQVTGGKTVQIVATNTNATYEFDVTFVSGGVKLIGTHGTTFNGAKTLFLANTKSVSAQLGDGDDHVRITGKAQNVTLSLGGEERRTVFAGIKSAYEPSALVGRLVVCVANLAPRQMTFGVSEGMVVAAGAGGTEIFLLSPDAGAKPGHRLH